MFLGKEEKRMLGRIAWSYSLVLLMFIVETGRIGGKERERKKEQGEKLQSTEY